MGRIFTYHGISYPPFKAHKMKDGATTLTFIVKSKRIVSKKNTDAIWIERGRAVNFGKELLKSGKQIVLKDLCEMVDLVYGRFRAGDAYKELVEQQKPILEKQRQFWLNKLQGKGLVFPLTKAKVAMDFYFSANHKQDISNKEATLLDMLVDCLILADDSFQILPEIHTRGALFSDEIDKNIVVIKITVNL